MLPKINELSNQQYNLHVKGNVQTTNAIISQKSGIIRVKESINNSKV